MSPHPSPREGHHSTAQWNWSFPLSHLILLSCHAATNPLDAIAPSTRARRSGPDSAFPIGPTKSSATFLNGEPFPRK
jgi:hypothetical protein